MINDEIKNYMHKFIEEICNQIGPRESGTKQEALAGDQIEVEFKKFCNETHQETYMSSPHAFLGGIRYGAMMVLLAIIFYWVILLNDLKFVLLSDLFILSFLIIAIILIILTVSYFILEVMKYVEAFDFLFPRKESKNIIGTINPHNKVKNTIIFSAHHDSAFEFNTFYYLKRFGQITINIGYLGVVIIFFGMVLRLLFYILKIELTILFFIFGIIFLAFLPIIFVYIFFHSYSPVLGAFDNLSGVAILLGIGMLLSKNRNNKDIFPQNTEIQLISFAGEESGLRGAKRYVKVHYKELMEKKTIVINMDSIGKKDKIIIHNKESGIGVKHNLSVYEQLLKIANNLKYNAKILPLPFGATDGAAFSKKNIPAASLGSLNLKEELAPYYHTRLDTPDVVEKEALIQILEICIEYLIFIDKR